ncbi:MAG: CD225/dispanin family protein [Flavobacteriaceae bacterium]|nr:CD225/dispanin family protein [Flavobacteriaceae bacterium]
MGLMAYYNSSKVDELLSKNDYVNAEKYSKRVSFLVSASVISGFIVFVYFLV